MSSPHPTISAGDHKAYMSYALTLARLSPPKPTNYRVGALLVDTYKKLNLATPYTLELEGNTHAEQVCFMKIAEKYGVREEDIGGYLPVNTVLYTTMEPCNKRSPGNVPCVERLLRYGDGIKIVFAGVLEPDKFVGQNLGSERLRSGGVQVELVEGLEEEILEVATAEHGKE